VQINLFEQGLDSHSDNPFRTLGNRHRKLLNLDEEVARLAPVKLSDGDVHGAIRMLASDDSYVVPNIQALAQHRNLAQHWHNRQIFSAKYSGYQNILPRHQTGVWCLRLPPHHSSVA